MTKRKPAPPQIRDSQQETEAMGLKVTETTVWHQGQSQTFTPEEIEAGAAERWMKAL